MTEVKGTGRTSQTPGQAIISLFVATWLMIVQPGMSYYWLINPAMHAEIDAQLYGQSPAGQTLPGRTPQAPHQHPTGLGMNVPDPTLLNPFDTIICQTLAAESERPALLGCLNEAGVMARSIAIEPPLQPPRPLR